MYVHNARQAETRRIKNIFRGATAHAYGENSNYSTHHIYIQKVKCFVAVLILARTF